MGRFLALGDFFAVMARWVWGLGAAYIPRIVAQTLLMFGLTVATRTWLAPDVKGFLAPYFGSLPSAALGLMGYLKVDIAISIILSAIVVKMSSSVSLQKKTP